MPPCVVFVNDADLYSSRELGQLLSQSVIGRTIDPAEEEEEEGEEGAAGATGECYTVVGTLSDPSARPSWLTSVVEASDREALRGVLLSCDVVAYNLVTSAGAVEEAMWAVSELQGAQEGFAQPKLFVGLSTCMTWAKTKPADPDDPEAPLGEDEYRRRRAHLNFKPHIAAEKHIVKCGKQEGSKLSTYVVTSGLLYGAEEAALHFLFKLAWHMAPESLPVIGPGENVVPTVHVRDFAAAVINVVESKPEHRYILAVDDSQHTLEEITTAISDTLGTGKTKGIPKQDALVFPELAQSAYDALTADIRLDAPTIKEFQIDWVAQDGPVENMAALIQEYKAARGLKPVKVVVAGPPGSGTADLAQALAAEYKIPHLHRQAVIDGKLAALEKSASVLDLPEEEQPEDTDEAVADKEALESLRQHFEEHGKYEEESVMEWFQERVQGRASSNQGYVISGFVEVEAQAKELFAPGPEADVEDPDQPDPALLPEFVFELRASDDFLKERVMDLPQEQVAGTDLEEAPFLKALADYRARNTEEETVLNFYDYLEIHPTPIDLEKSVPAVVVARQAIGAPRNYGPTPEEAEESKRLQDMAAAAKHEEEEEATARLLATTAQDDAKAQLEWDERRAEVKRQEQEALEEASLPLRNFLMKNIMPTLTKGLMEVCKTRPEDPIDYLAEFLFQNSPQIQ